MVRGILMFQLCLRHVLATSDGGQFPLECAKDLLPLVRACVSHTNPYHLGSRTAFCDVSAAAFANAATLVDTEFPVSPHWEAQMRDHLRSASGMLTSQAEAVVQVHMSVMCGEALRRVVRAHLRQRCAVTDDTMLDRALDSDALSGADMAVLSSSTHMSTTTRLLASAIVQMYHGARDVEALRKRRGAAAADVEGKPAELDPGPAGEDTDTLQRICKSLSLKWLLLQHEDQRLPALAPVPACTGRALPVTQQCVGPILSAAASQLSALASSAVAKDPTAAHDLRQRSNMLQMLADRGDLPVEAILSPIHHVAGPLLVRRGHLGVATLMFLGAEFHITVPRVVLYTVTKPRAGVHCREVNFGYRGHVLRQAPGSVGWGTGRSRSPADFLSQLCGEFDITAVPLHWDAAAEGATWIAADPGG